MPPTIQYRQGDILLEKINAPHRLGRKIKRPTQNKEGLILVKGEQTGHAHVVMDEEAVLYRAKQDRFLKVLNLCELRHEEHSAILLEPGFYRVTRQRVGEYMGGWIGSGND